MAASDKTPTVAEKMAVAMKDRIADKANARKAYRLRVISTPDRPAPFESVTIAGHAFSEKTHRHVQDSRGRLAKEERTGCYEQLTDSEVAKIRAKVGDYIVRWRSRPALIAQVIDASIPTVVIDPDTDEAIEPYLLIEEAPK